MPKDRERGKEMDAHERLKWQTARELGLDDDLANAGDELTVREAGKIGGNMVRKLIKAGEKALAEENSKERQ
ncbi:MAG: alpha/beta-type small acid-soluble spore protein [Firmicutes bacterium]|nr:alpha/beta-type small acid-soluble spore protein [Bacillota bacterium]